MALTDTVEAIDPYTGDRVSIDTAQILERGINSYVFPRDLALELSARCMTEAEFLEEALARLSLIERGKIFLED